MGLIDMQFTISINQAKALDWGLNAQQALLFAFVYEAPSWANAHKSEDGVYYVLTKAKIIEELPLLTDKPDTAYRLLKQLRDIGVIDLSSTSSTTLVRLTDKGKTWNRKRDGSEKYPTLTAESGRKKIRSWSEKSPTSLGEKSDLGSEKNPTNQDTSNQDTNPKAKARAARPAKFDPLTCKPDGVSDESWAGFCDMRKGKGKALTERACSLIAKKLQDHTNPSAVVDLSTENGWSGVFPESQQVSRHENRPASSGRGTLSAADRVKQAIAEREASEVGPAPTGLAVDENGGNVRAPLDGQFRRVS
jgi:DNA-binding PadR family transcriptional regulator